MNRLVRAYRRLWDRHPAIVYVTLLAVIIASPFGLVAACLLSPYWVPLPVAAFASAVLLVNFSFDEGKNEAGQ